MLLIKSPTYNNWFIHNKPKKSLIICTAYLKNNALNKLFETYGITSDENSINIEVLIRGNLSDFLNKSSDISALESLIKIKNLDIENVRRLTNLHMKAYLIDDKELLIGSANLTNSGLFANGYSGNIEQAIAINEENIISDFKSYYSEIIKEGEPLDIFYDKVIDYYKRNIDKASERIKSLFSGEGDKGPRYKFPSGKVTVFRPIGNITPAEVPQFSKFEDGVYKVVDILVENGDIGFNFLELGKLLERKDKKDGAHIKYGENHAKLAELLDLVTITNSPKETHRKAYLTRLGGYFHSSDDVTKTNIIKSQILNMDIVKDIIDKYNYENFNLDDYLNSILAETTTKRRKPNVKFLFKYLYKNGEEEIKPILDRLDR